MVGHDPGVSLRLLYLVFRQVLGLASAGSIMSGSPAPLLTQRGTISNGIHPLELRPGRPRPAQEGRVLAGVIAGLGRRIGLDPWPARLLATKPFPQRLRPHRSRGRARGRQYPRTPRRTSPCDAPTAAIHFQRNLQPRPRPHPAPALPAPPPIPAPRPSLDGGRPGDREHHKGGWRDLYQWLEISGADEMSIRPSAAKIAPTAAKTIGAVKSAPFEPC